MIQLIEDACQTVFEALGPGLSESVYQRALAVELRSRGQHVSMEVIIPILYKHAQVGFIRYKHLKAPQLENFGSHRADIILNEGETGESVILELKAKAGISPADRIQAATYKKYYEQRNVPVFLVNFGCDCKVEECE